MFLKIFNTKLFSPEYLSTAWSRSTTATTTICKRHKSITCLENSSATPQSAGTMSEVYGKIMNHLGLGLRYTPVPRTREHLLQYAPNMQDLPKRSLADSYSTAVIPLSTSNRLHNSYVSILGSVRLGRLMEDMDMFAVWICHQHVCLPNLPKDVDLPYTFVTIRVDKVSFSEYLPKSDKDIRLSGHISWVGRTSMEITVWMEQKDDDNYKKITQAVFLMAARNAPNTGSAVINPVEPANDLEKTILAEGDNRKKFRAQTQAQSVFKTEPNDYEQSVMYDIFKRTTPVNTNQLNVRILPPNCRWMSDSFATNTIASFPENRNAHNKVFGGFLMRNAQEISWISAYMFAKSRPRAQHISDISFDKPVPVSSFIRMSAYVVYTELNLLQVKTVADVLDTFSGEQITTNVFYTTFRTQEPVPEVLPRTYHEAMWYLEGRRKFKYALDLE